MDAGVGGSVGKCCSAMFAVSSAAAGLPAATATSGVVDPPRDESTPRPSLDRTPRSCSRAQARPDRPNGYRQPSRYLLCCGPASKLEPSTRTSPRYRGVPTTFDLQAAGPPYRLKGSPDARIRMRRAIARMATGACRDRASGIVTRPLHRPPAQPPPLGIIERLQGCEVLSPGSATSCF